MSPSVADPNVIQASSLRGANGKQKEDHSVLYENVSCDHPIYTCGHVRCVDPPFPVPDSSAYGYLNDKNPGRGAQFQEYNETCKYVNDDLGPAGCGKLTEFAVATCTDKEGCPLYRVFDEPLHIKNITDELSLGAARGCGHSWSPPASIKGKSLEKYLEDAGVCTYKYAPCRALNKTTAFDGNVGGYLLKCFAPYGRPFTLGPTQSTNCIARDSTTYTLPANSNLQVFWGSDYDFQKDCEYCAIQKSEDGTYPDATACDESSKRMVRLTANCSNQI